MDSGYYAACTGLLAKEDALELAANNLANTSTNGYKAQMEFYRSLTASLSGRRLSPLNQAVNDYGVLGGATLDLQAGEFVKTGNDLDLALEGSGFFVIQTPAGVRYTRNGSFHADASGRLVTSTGDPVLGEEGPIDLPSGSLSVSSDGTISQQGAVVARLKIVTFPPGTTLLPEGNSLYQAPQGSELPADDPRVAQGSLESSNLNPVAGAVSLVALQRHAQLLRQALSIFHSTFNSAAVQELPRVS
jgi:flagellar basal-body rod protein FlgF/flagellar basal-body rod protein FlgG